jgi:hypothetical protein
MASWLMAVATLGRTGVLRLHIEHGPGGAPEQYAARDRRSHQSVRWVDQVEDPQERRAKYRIGACGGVQTVHACVDQPNPYRPGPVDLGEAKVRANGDGPRPVDQLARPAEEAPPQSVPVACEEGTWQPRLCAQGATVIWTRTRRAPDLTPQVRG